MVADELVIYIYIYIQGCGVNRKIMIYNGLKIMNVLTNIAIPCLPNSGLRRQVGKGHICVYSITLTKCNISKIFLADMIKK